MSDDLKTERRTLNAGEQRLVADLGVYGCWILKHGKTLHREHPIALAYKDYRETHNYRDTKNLFRAIDDHCKSSGCEQVFQDYELALEDLLAGATQP